MRLSAIFFMVQFFLGLLSFGQGNLNYLNHILLSADTYGNKHFRLSKLPDNDRYISHFRLSTPESGSIGLGLSDTPEPYSFQPLEPGITTDFNVFRIHNAELGTEFLIEAKTHNALTAQTGSAGMEYTDAGFIIETSLDTMGYIQIGSDLTFNNTSETFQNYCLFNYDENQDLSTQRIISHKPFSFVSHFGKTHAMSGTMNETLTCQDFNFKDSIIIAYPGTSEVYFSEEFVPFLEAKYASGAAYSGLLSFDGVLDLLHAAVWNENVYRLFSISGDADLDPTSQTYDYSTPADEAHLILACYDPDGHVLWLRTMSIFSNEMEDAGTYTGKIIMLNMHLAIDYSYAANPNNGASSGTFQAMNGEESLESGDMIVEGSYRHSPRYIHTIEPETGNTTSVISARLENSFENFARNNNNLSVELVETDLVSISKLHLNYLWDDLTVRSHFPTVDSLTSSLEPLTNYCQEFVLVNVNDFYDIEHHFLAADNLGNNGFFSTFSISIKDDSHYLMAGNVSNGNLHFIFINDTAEVSSNNGSNGLVFYLEKTLVNTENDKMPLFHIFPNPASGFIQIDGNFDFPTPYQIIDLSGKEIKRGHIGLDHRIGLNGISSGLYILKFPPSDNRGYKFIVE